jgi:Ca2+-transporting ATPase
LVAGLFVMALRQNLPNQMRGHWRLPHWLRPISASCSSTVRWGASVFAAFTRPNAALWWVVVATAAILTGVILFPPARELFHFGPLHGDDVTIAVASGLIALELAKKLIQPMLAARLPRTSAVSR